ncbi:MAG: hypothetical protein ACK5U6_17585 [Pseudanabaena sp.]|jgi:hypothetical protein
MPKIFKGCDVLDASKLTNDEFLPQVGRTSTYYPLPHIGFYMNAATVLTELGIGIVSNSFGLTPKRDRMFMWLETDAKINDMPLCIGGRNSYDKSMSAGLCVGTKILVCSNKVLASYENGGVVSRKHTSAENIDELSREFSELVKVQQLPNRKTLFEGLSVAKETGLSDRAAKELLVDLVLSNVIAPTDIPLIWKEFYEPSYSEFKSTSRTWRMLMACTEVFKLHKGVDYQIKAYDGVARALGL